MRALRRFTVRTVLPPPLGGLDELAMNLRWCWHWEAEELFASLDPRGWERVGHDPVRLLGGLSPERLAALAADRRVVRRVQDALDELHDYLATDRWYQTLEGAPGVIAYFSPEFGVSHVLRQYSGGLGILAGDHLKAASDLGVPVVGVGLLYRQGYFRQSLSREGWQQERYPLIDPDEMPLTLLREPDGSHALVEIDLPDDRRIVAQIWVAHVGRVPLLLLDSNTEVNGPVEREVTDRLYGGGGEHRLLQEMLLGIGGVRAVRAHGRLTGWPAPEVFHTNEGHAGFLGVERISELVQRSGLAFPEALEAVRAGTVFTTHTPVPAGIDRFSRDLVAQHFAGGLACPGVSLEHVLELGAETYPGGDPTVFNMAVMGLRLAQRANGVSRLHGKVSREMFAGLWPDFDTSEVPIGSVTNGVHAPSWVAPEVMAMAERDGGRALLERGEGWERVVSGPSDGELWQVKRVLRERLVRDARRRVHESWRQRGASDAELGWVDGVLDPAVLTIGFARRAATYKRLTLMLRDRERLRGLLLHPSRPVQVVIAGKAHPDDDTGKRLIQEIVRFADEPDVRHRIVFLPDYDMAMAAALYPGCDVWLNTPLRPYEACGTSGMKAALGGALNLSVRDGWWDEWYDGGNGWAIPSADGVHDPEHRDDLEAGALYDVVEQQVAPRFYDVDDDGLPRRWLEMARHTIGSLGPKVLATRMVRDYVRDLYLPAARSAHALDTDFGAARDLAAWKHRVAAAWSDVLVDHVEPGGVGDSPQLGSTLTLRVYVTLGSLAPGDVEVQAVHGRVADDDSIPDPQVCPLAVVETYEGGRHRYEGEVALDRTGPFGYTVRVVPSHPHLASPAELGLSAVPADLPSP